MFKSELPKVNITDSSGCRLATPECGMPDLTRSDGSWTIYLSSDFCSTSQNRGLNVFEWLDSFHATVKRIFDIFPLNTVQLSYWQEKFLEYYDPVDPRSHLKLFLQIYTMPFTMLPTSAVETPGNL